ncbi:MAG: hypothetical protein IJV91_12150, partial [Kiritimatiellae bacterium]|nr:hypothetical protein [Kiritimatiellia bacterium]
MTDDLVLAALHQAAFRRLCSYDRRRMLRRAGPKNITSYSTSAELEVGSDCGLLCALRLDLGG